MPFDAHHESNLPLQKGADEASLLLSNCAREAQVFVGGSLQGAFNYAKDHPVNAAVDAALGIGIGLATKNYTGLAHLMTVGAAGMILSSELGKLAKGDLPKIFTETWHHKGDMTADSKKVGEILGATTFNALTIAACAGGATAYGKYAGRFSLADTDALKIGNNNFASNYYGKRFDRTPGVGYTVLDENGIKQPVATSIKELQYGADKLPFEAQKNLYLERATRPIAESDGLSSYTGKFAQTNINEFKRLAERHTSMMDEKFQPNPITTEIAE